MDVIITLLVLLVPVLLIVLLVKVANLKKRAKTQDNKLEYMWSSLNDRIDHMQQKEDNYPDEYQQGAPVVPPQYTQSHQTMAPPPQQVRQPAPPYSSPPYAQPAPPYSPPPYVQPAPPYSPPPYVQPPSPYSPTSYVQPTPPYSPPAHLEAQPQQSGQMGAAYSAPQVLAEAQLPPENVWQKEEHAFPPVPPSVPERKRKFNEGWIGRILFGIAASTLIFIGLLFLGIWAWNKIGDGLKVILMFAGSGLITGLGIVLGLKKQNAFTVILTGCGCGAAFISTLVTYLYYNMIGDIPAYCILLGWLVAVLAITRMQKSVYLSIVAHLGMAISICFACSQMAYGNLGFLLAYQFTSVAVIIAGNLLCCRETYRFGLFLSLGITITVCGFMHGMSDWAHLIVIFGVVPPDGFITWNMALAFCAQFLCASCLSCLLSVSTTRVTDDTVKSLLHVLNKLMWIVMLFITVYPTVMGLAVQAQYRFSLNGIPSPLLLSVLVCFAVTALHIAITILMRRKFNFSPLLESISAGLMSGVWFVLLVQLRVSQMYGTFPALSYMFIPGLILLGVGRISRNSVYKWAASAFFAVDLLSALAISYAGLPSGSVIAIAGGYIVVYLGLILLMRKKLDFDEIWERAAVYFAGGVWLLLLVILWLGGYIIKTPNLAFLCIPGLLLLGVGRISRNSAYKWAACAFFAADLLSALGIRYAGLPLGNVIALAALYIVFYLGLILFMRKKLDFGEIWECIAVYFAGGVWLILLGILWRGGHVIKSPNLAFLCIPGLLLLGAGRISRNSAYKWAASAFFAADLLSALAIRYTGLPLGNVIALAALYIVFYLGLILFMRKKLDFGEIWECIAVYFTGGVWLVLLGILWWGGYIIKTPNLAFLCIPGLLLLGAGRISRNSAYKYTANVFIIIDLIFMLAVGYRELTQVATIAAPLGYMLLYLAVLWLQWPPVAHKNKDASMPARLGAYAIVFVSLIGILLASDLANKEVILLLSLTALGITLFLLHYDKDLKRDASKGFAPLHMTMRIIEFMLYVSNTFAIAFMEKQTVTAIILFWSLAALTAAIGFMRVRDVLKNPHTAEHIFLGLMITGIILAVIRGFAPGWFDAVYVLSLASMVSALLCVIIGFISRVKALRLYGLILTLLCVLKLITYDVRDLNTSLRIISLISGGIICFAISALYSYSEERLKRK